MKSVSAKRLCKILEAKGWILVRIAGSHHIYRKEGFRIALTVPVHANRDLAIGTLKSIIKLAGLNDQDLL